MQPPGQPPSLPQPRAPVPPAREVDTDHGDLLRVARVQSCLPHLRRGQNGPESVTGQPNARETPGKGTRQGNWGPVSPPRRGFQDTMWSCSIEFRTAPHSLLRDTGYSCLVTLPHPQPKCPCHPASELRPAPASGTAGRGVSVSPRGNSFPVVMSLLAGKDVQFHGSCDLCLQITPPRICSAHLRAPPASLLALGLSTSTLHGRW